MTIVHLTYDGDRVTSTCKCHSLLTRVIALNFQSRLNCRVEAAGIKKHSVSSVFFDSVCLQTFGKILFLHRFASLDLFFRMPKAAGLQVS